MNEVALSPNMSLDLFSMSLFSTPVLKLFLGDLCFIGPVQHFIWPVQHVIRPVQHVIGPVQHVIGPLREFQERKKKRIFWMKTIVLAESLQDENTDTNGTLGRPSPTHPKACIYRREKLKTQIYFLAAKKQEYILKITVAKLSKFLGDLTLHYRDTPDLDSSAKSEDYMNSLECLCKSNETPNLLTFLKEWINEGFLSSPKKPLAKKHKSKENSEDTDDKSSTKHILAVHMLLAVLDHHSCQKAIMRNPEILKEFLDFIDDIKVYFKLNAVEKANEVGNREAARFFNVDESNICLWRRNKTNFENCDRRKRADRRGKPHLPELEAEINKWILKERDNGKAVSTVSIRMKARVIAREMNIVNFSGGPTWCYRFMKRNNLVVQRSDRNYLMTGGKNLTTF
ncbi:pogo transposable element with KRAB [Trichonephila clavipes]|nr:pogo transposable element with KRAB [Trichonephila clavipes]